MRRAHQYLFWRDEAARANREKARATAVAGDRKANWIKDYVLANGEKEGKDVVLLFDEPLTIGDVTYRGFKAQASTPHPYMEEDEVLELVRAKGLADRVIKTIEVVDFDQLYVLNQEGAITDAELDGLMHQDEPTYSLEVIR